MEEQEILKEEVKKEVTSGNNQKQQFVVFVSGSDKCTDKQFIQYYLPILNGLVELEEEEDIYYVMSDDEGAAAYTQLFLRDKLKDHKKVSIFSTKNKPKNYLHTDYIFVPGFKSIEERNAAMTFISNKDIHLILDGTNTKQIVNNITRRLTPGYDWKKHIEGGNELFWSSLGLNEKVEVDMDGAMTSVKEVVE